MGKRVLRANYLVFILIGIFIFLAIHTLLRKEEDKKEILIYENMPRGFVDSLQASFPDYKIEESPKGHILSLLKGAPLIMSKDMEAQSFLEGNPGYFFYPLYRDSLVIGVDRDEIKDDINSFLDLLDLGTTISTSDVHPDILHIWNSISYSEIKAFDQKYAANFFRDLAKNNVIRWDQAKSPIEINFKSKIGSHKEIVVPDKGTLSYEVGLLSKKEIPDEIIEKLRLEVLDLDFQEGDDAGQVIKEIKGFFDVKSLRNLERRIAKNERVYSTATSEEHHLVSLIVIVVILFWIVSTQRRVIHSGVKRGLLIIGSLLISLILLGIFKYALFGYTPVAHGSWYLYYLFILPLPVVSLYIAENSDKLDTSSFPLWLKISIGILIFFVILVFTNDYHQLVFKFLTDIPEKRGDEYSYRIGFFLLTIWSGISQLAAFFMMQIKGLDSPNKRKTILPGLGLLVYMAYIMGYNLRFSLISDFPLVLGTSIVITSYWTLAIYSGLIPSNKGYMRLFEASDINLSIVDNSGLVHYSGVSDIDLPSRLLNKENIDKYGNTLINYYQEDDYLYWSTPISGGQAINQESIKDINDLRRELESITGDLERENMLLLRKERIDRRLVRLDEQNRLAEEVYEAIKSKLIRMEALIDRVEVEPTYQEAYVSEIQMLAIYCKRRSELLIKSKSKDFIPAQELCRIIQEMGSVLPPTYSIFCQMSGNMSFEDASNLYDYYELINETCLENKVGAINIRFTKIDNIFNIKLLLEGEAEKFNKDLIKIIENDSKISLSEKNFEDSLALSLEIRGGDQ